MVAEQPDRKTVGLSRLSLVSRSLDGALRGTTPMAPLQEPWRDHKQKGKERGSERSRQVKTDGCLGDAVGPCCDNCRRTAQTKGGL